ncbi:hypothetical protein QTH91_19330 [Variovorax dokdonensis]|uniref:Amino acid--[acyl-carrier-protein] ligase n=1 Tax=Variovorax dokdonensis TaxID=344883 RepID=A0ABT7NFC5_9BURK|nr:hypothetical protein [Variovorax dokdonensis]MDM0046651.1 hypothetical protein [Variovorax dokdonensis]
MPALLDAQALHDQLALHGLIIPSGLPGAYGRGAAFEHVIERFDALVMRSDEGKRAQRMTFPPIVAREMASAAAAGQRWEHGLDITDGMLVPAACYPVYPTFSGLLPQGGRTVTVLGWCYRHEPSIEPTRLQSFRMREFIRVGAPSLVEAWRDAWLDRGIVLLESLGLDARSDTANDPFFGRSGRMLAQSQKEQRLKFEIMVPVMRDRAPTALCSFNWHQQHFTGKFGVVNHDGEPAHTACLGFGLERMAIALFATHGFRLRDWPASVRALLEIDAAIDDPAGAVVKQA